MAALTDLIPGAHSVAEGVEVGLKVLDDLADKLPDPEKTLVHQALAIVRVLLEEGENVADAVRKVRAVYSAKAQDIANTFDR